MTNLRQLQSLTHRLNVSAARGAGAGEQTFTVIHTFTGGQDGPLPKLA
jgi:hypothetical protein